MKKELSLFTILSLGLVLFIASCGGGSNVDIDSTIVNPSENSGVINPSTFPFIPSTHIEDVYYTATFNTNGGSTINPISIKEGEKLTRPTNPSKEGFVFIDWYKDDKLSELYDFDEKVYGNFSLFAKWEDNGGEITYLNAPRLSLDGYKITWEEVNNAISYHIIVKGEVNSNKQIFLEEDISNTYFEFDDSFEPNIYTVQVRTNGDNIKFFSSEYSFIDVRHKVLQEVEHYTYNQDTCIFEWDEVENATSYELFANNVSLGEFTHPSFDFSNYNVGVYNTKIIAKSSGLLPSTTLIRLEKLKFNKPYEISYGFNEGVYTVNWTDVYKASGYIVYANGVEIDRVKISTYKFDNSFSYFSDEKVDIFVVAIDENGHYINSDVSDTVTVKKVYAVSYVLDGGTNHPYNPKYYEVEREYILRDAEDNNRLFLGWTLNGEYITEISSDFTGDITLVANWIPYEYYVDLDLDGGELSVDKSLVKIGKAYSLPTPNKRGYRFIGWYHDDTKIDNEGIWTYYFDNLRAKWEIVTYYVNFSDVQMNSIPFTINDSFDLPRLSNFGTKYFKDWEDENNNVVKRIEMGTVGNVNLHATWTQIYGILYYLDGGTNNPNNPNIFTEDDEIIFEEPSRKGYRFLGWTDYFGDPFSMIGKGTKNDVSVYARWEALKYDIALDANGGELDIDFIEVTYGKSYELPVPVRNGYTFVSWLNGTHIIHLRDNWYETSINNLTASWKANNYEVSLFDNDGKYAQGYDVKFMMNDGTDTVYLTKHVTSNELGVLTLPEYPKNGNKVCNGWYLDPECKEPFNFLYDVTSNLKLYAGWTNALRPSEEVDVSFATASNPKQLLPVTSNWINPSTAYFVCYNHGTINLMYRYYAATYTSPKVRVYVQNVTRGTSYMRDGVVTASYSFSSLPLRVYRGDIISISVIAFTNYIESTWLQFYCENYSTSQSEGANAPKELTPYLRSYEIGYNSDFTLRVPSEKEGRNFIGWFDSNGVQYTDENAVSIRKWDHAEDTRLYAGYDKFYITYELNRGSIEGNNPTEYSLGDELTFISPTREGYTFGGWYSDSQFENKVETLHYDDFFKSITLYAKWIAIQHTITFITGTDQVIEPITAGYEEPITAPINPTKVGYNFIGWDIEFPETMPNEDLVLTALWEIKQFTVTWQKYKNSGVIYSELVNYGELPIYTGEIPTIEDTAQYTYRFTGWSPEISPVVANVTYKALFAQTTRKYEITWQNYDGTILEVDNVAYGTTPTYEGPTPTKTLNDGKVYLWSGTWEENLVQAAGDKTYTAAFITLEISYDLENQLATIKSATVPYKSKSCVIPDSVYYNEVLYTIYKIDNDAFAAKSLEYITLPDTIEVIGSKAFRSSSIKRIVISNSVKSIGFEAFANCTSLIEVVMGNSVTSFGNSMFLQCSKLETVNLPDGISFIGQSIFEGCSALSSINLPSELSSIGADAFKNCSSLKDINLPTTLHSIGSSAFSGCTSLGSIVIPSGISRIESWTFYGCSSLANVVLNEGLTSIGSMAFYHTVIQNIDLPNSLETLGSKCFAGTNLISVYISKNVVEIDHSFINCLYLKEIIVDSANANYYSSNGVLYNKDVTTLYIYPSAKTDTSFTLPNTIITIGESAFANNDTLTSITLPSSLTTIEESAFYNVTNLKSISLPKKLVSIGDFAFCNSGLTSISIPSSVINIGICVFMDCSSLKSASLPSNLTSIPNQMFERCGLTSITIPSSVTSIGAYAFDNCDKLTGTITIPSKVEVIDYFSFCGCSGISTINIGKAVTIIGNGAFEGCVKLATVYNYSSLDIQVGSSAYGGVAYYATKVVKK